MSRYHEETMSVIEHLRQSVLFSGLDDRSLMRLAASAKTRDLAPREYLFSEGDQGLHFYLLMAGCFRVFKTSLDGRETTIKLIHPGEFFAEAVLFARKNYPATAVATEKSRVLCLHRDTFLELLDEKAPRQAFIAGIFEKLRFLTDQIHFLTSHDVEDRFFMFLMKTYGKDYRYDISLSKKDIASAIGATPETFSRLILRLTTLGVIAWKKNTLLIREGFWENDLFIE
jgi:CRP/FNR family transcriptional regulator